jgi:hypothetical protein
MGRKIIHKENKRCKLICAELEKFASRNMNKRFLEFLFPEKLYFYENTKDKSKMELHDSVNKLQSLIVEVNSLKVDIIQLFTFKGFTDASKPDINIDYFSGTVNLWNFDGEICQMPIDKALKLQDEKGYITMKDMEKYRVDPFRD